MAKSAADLDRVLKAAWIEIADEFKRHVTEQFSKATEGRQRLVENGHY